MKFSKSLIALTALVAGANAFAPRAPVQLSKQASITTPTSLWQAVPVDPDDEDRSERASLDIVSMI